MNIKKRSGETEPFQLDKIHRVLEWATEGIEDVSISDIEMNAKLNIVDGTSTKDIHAILIKSANNLISIENPNYQNVASRLLTYSLRKDVWGESEPPRLIDHIKKCVKSGVYDKEILTKYSESELMKLGKYVKHERDNLFTYSGIQQMVDKYLIKNRNTGEIFETPQFAYMLIAMVCFAEYDSKIRIQYVKRAYDAFSTFKINLPTPIMSGVRTNIKQFASCILIDVDDSLDSIFASNTAVGLYTARRAGIGLNIGRIRPINSSIRGGEVVHTGVIPYLKMFESTCKSTSQNGVRGGGATCNIPFWHYEIEDVIVLKDNAGTDDNRVRKLDYVVQFSKIFYERLIKGEDITLFSPAECPELYQSFGLPEFDELYKAKEKDENLTFRKTISAKAFAELFARNRLETGRIYVMNMDNVNNHNSFIDKINMTNLCVEVLQHTNPINKIEDTEGEIGVCVLSSINLLNVDFDEFEDICDILVRLLDELIDYQDYMLLAAKNFCTKRRSLGIGITNFAGILAKNKISYESQEALELADKIGEYMSYYCIKSSSNLAKEKGKCKKNKYDRGEFPIDRANKNALKLTTREFELDWETLRTSIKENGVRNTTLLCCQPNESSSVIQNSTNGIEPIRSLLAFKESKKGILKQLAPNLKRYGKHYTLAWDIKDNTCLTNISAVLQKWIDMGISTNHYYNYTHYEGGNIPLSRIIKDMIYAYKVGVKSLYYCNTPDGSAEMTLSNTGCDSGACAI